MNRRAAARDFESALVRALDRDLDLIDLARDLDLACKRVHNLYLALERLRDLDQDSATPAGAQVTSGPVSRGLVALAVRLLPAAQRPRYSAEFRGELVGLRRRERWGYALRVLASAWELRRALVAAVRTPDGDVARRAER